MLACASPAGRPLDVHCSTDRCDDLLHPGALGLLAAFALRTGFFESFAQHLQVSLKTCDYTPLQKLQTLLCSLAAGCEWTKDINHTLRPYPVVAEMLGMAQFPDQSSINRFLHHLGGAQRQQLELISELLLARFGLWRQLERVDLDLDSTGLMVYGRTYEGRRKGYFPRQRGRWGYRMTVASTSRPPGPEILALSLDPANVSPAPRFWDCLYQAADVLGSLDRLGVIRADASWGTGADIQELVDLGLTFIVKGYSNQTARKFAADVAPTQWESLDLFTRVCDLGPQRISHCRHPVRVVLVALMTQRYDRSFDSHLYTNLSPEQGDAEQIFTRYNGRQCIEALFKSAKYGLSIDHLRTRRYHPIENFLQVAAITFNLLSWFRSYVLAQVGLDDLGLCGLTHTLMDIPAKCTREDNQLRLSFPARHPLAPTLAQL